MSAVKQRSNSGSCLERNKIRGECCSRGYCALHGRVVSVVAADHLPCIVEHHGGGERECSGVDFHGSCVSLIRGDRGCVGAMAMVERRWCARRCCLLLLVISFCRMSA